MLVQVLTEIEPQNIRYLGFARVACPQVPSDIEEAACVALL